MKIAFFLGAGASVPFDKPTTRQLRRELRDKHPRKEGNEMLWSLLDHHSEGDIEDILQTIKDLKVFFENKGGIFLDNEFKILLSKNNDNGSGFIVSSGKKLQHENTGMNFKTFMSSIIKTEKLLEDEIFHFYQWNHKHDQKVGIMYNKIFQKLGQHEIRFGTTNYDRVIEEYCIKSKKLCVDGFRFDSYSGKHIWQNGNYPLPYDVDNNASKTWIYKLHGSLNWRQHVSYGIVKTDDESKSSLDQKYLKNLLIYPTISPKDGHDVEPFKIIRKRFIEYLDTADVCVVIGFSFRDEHVNDFLKKFIESKKPLIVISPSMPDDLYGKLVEKDQYDFGYMGEENIVDKSNITVFRGEFELNSIDKILEVIISRGKIK